MGSTDRGRWTRRAFVAALTGLGATAARAQTLTVVRWAGALRDVMRGDASARVDLASLAGLANLYAVGALDGLRGEITVLDGEPSIARVVDGRIAVESGYAHRAALLVWTQVESWREVPVPAGLADLAALERFLASAAAEAGFGRHPYPFLVRGRPERVDLHVLDRRGDAPHSPAAHERSKARFTLEGVAVELLGFHSEEHQGVWTHHGSATHVHVRTADRRQSGHVDALRLGAGPATLLLPR